MAYWPDDLAAIAEALLDAKSSAADTFGGVLVNEAGQILLRKPTGQFGGYAWTFAKGNPNPGESAETAALREVREETGYDARITGLLPRVFQGDTSTTLFFLMAPVGDQHSFGEETACTKWVDFDEAKILVSTNRTMVGRERDLSVIADTQDIIDAFQ